MMSSKLKPLITIPAMAAGRLPPRTKPTMLTASAAGGVRSNVSPPRAANGEPHPGFSEIISTTTTGATSDSHKPIRPAREGGLVAGG